MRPYFIGIAGGTGSGKSTFANRLFQTFPNDVSMITFDSYYKSQEQIPFEERCKVNYDCPDALDTPLLMQHLNQLSNYKTVFAPIYDFKTHTRTKCQQQILPHDVIIVDGILIFHNHELRDFFDLKIFVDVNADERILRRIKRDVDERGRTIDSVMQQYLQTVRPMHDLYVEPTKKYADIIINGGMNKAAYELVKDKIERLVSLKAE